MAAHEKWEKFLNPVSLKQNLIACSVYLASYEMMKAALIDTLRGFFCDDYSQLPKWPVSENYRDKVLSLHKSEMTACATWFVNNGALEADDLLILRELADHRNTLAHEAQSVVGADTEVSILHLKLVYALTTKVDQWWLRNVEADINPALIDNPPTEEEFSQSYSIRMMMMSFMIEIAEGDDSRLAELYAGWKPSLGDAASTPL